MLSSTAAHVRAVTSNSTSTAPGEAGGATGSGHAEDCAPELLPSSTIVLIPLPIVFSVFVRLCRMDKAIRALPLCRSFARPGVCQPAWSAYQVGVNDY